MDPDYAIDDWAARAERQAARTVELSERLQQVRAFAESRGGEVVVTVDQSGGLADIGLDERAMRLSPSELGELILTTSRRAQARLAEQVNGMVSSLYGAGSETASFIGRTYSDRFPEPQDEDGDRR